MRDQVLVGFYASFMDSSGGTAKEPAVEFRAGVVRWTLYRRDEQGLISRRALVDNVHWRADTLAVDLSDRRCQALVAWNVSGLAHRELVRLFPEEIRANVDAELQRSTFDPLEWFRRQLGTGPTAEPVTLGALAEGQAPLVVGGQEQGADPNPYLLAKWWRDGQEFDVVAALRHRTRQLDRLLASGCYGRNPRLTLRAIDGEVPDAWRSPHVEHPETPMADDGGGTFKYLVPTNWWPYLDVIASQRGR